GLRQIADQEIRSASQVLARVGQIRRDIRHAERVLERRHRRADDDQAERRRGEQLDEAGAGFRVTRTMECGRHAHVEMYAVIEYVRVCGPALYVTVTVIERRSSDRSAIAIWRVKPSSVFVTSSNVPSC